MCCLKWPSPRLRPYRKRSCYLRVMVERRNSTSEITKVSSSVEKGGGAIYCTVSEQLDGF